MRSLIERTRSALNEALAIVDRIEEGGVSSKVADAVVVTKARTKHAKSIQNILSKARTKKPVSAQGRRKKQRGN
jgi:hypothetical protein